MEDIYALDWKSDVGGFQHREHHRRLVRNYNHLRDDTCVGACDKESEEDKRLFRRYAYVVPFGSADRSGSGKDRIRRFQLQGVFRFAV